MSKSLGAAQIWDYNSPAAIRDITAALSTKTLAGAFAIGDNCPEACMSIVSKCSGSESLAVVTFPMRPPTAHFPTVAMAYNFVTCNAFTTLKGWWRGIAWKLFMGTCLIHDDPESSLGIAIYEAYLPEALAPRKYLPAPEPPVVGDGLEAVQAALDQQRRGVSARKIVVTIW